MDIYEQLDCHEDDCVRFDEDEPCPVPPPDIGEVLRLECVGGDVTRL